jgi:molybdate transport system substrate-binding protein
MSLSTHPSRRAFALLVAALALLPCAASSQPSGNVTVFAAASLTDSLKSIADAYQAKTGTKITLSFGASSTLARQIEQGASADLFFSADTDWMDYLNKAGLIAQASRKDLLGNQLVLIAASTNSHDLKIAPHFDLAGALGDGRLALADPASVPAGKYAKAALTALGIWDSVASRVAPAENVRIALQYVARGEAPLGIVYGTDAKAETAVRVVGIFPDDSHPPIIYPVALTRAASPQAQDFLAFLEGPQARAIFVKAGFSSH